MGFNIYQRVTLIVILLIVSIGFLASCSTTKPYNTVYTVNAENIIKGRSYLSGYEEHVISDKNGQVYRIFQSPKHKTDSVYHIVKRMSYNRERSVQFYYKIVKPKKAKR